MPQTEITIDSMVAAKATGGTATLTPEARAYILSVLGEGASHTMKDTQEGTEHVFSAYPSPPPEDGERPIKVLVTMAAPDSEYASTILSENETFAEKVSTALTNYVPESPNMGGRHKKRKSRKTRKTRKGKKMTRRR